MILVPEGDHAPVSLSFLGDRGHGLPEGNMLGVDFEFEFIEYEGVVLVGTDDQALLRVSLSAIESEGANLECLNPDLKVETVDLGLNLGVVTQQVKVDEAIGCGEDQGLRGLCALFLVHPNCCVNVDLESLAGDVEEPGHIHLLTDKPAMVDRIQTQMKLPWEGLIRLGLV
jgi:hypothetical protein